MEGAGRQSRLLGRLLGKLRGEHHKFGSLDKTLSATSNGLSESTGCGSTITDKDILDPLNNVPPPKTSHTPIDDFQLSANIDLRYSGQYLTPEQLPEFCDQLHHLVEVIRNIQTYANVTGEYPSELERRLEQEAREVASLAAEARNALHVVSRARTQRKVVRAQKKHLLAHLANLRETEIRELESKVRSSDRKLYKSWETLKDSSDPSVFDPLLNEIESKQITLECLLRLIDGRRAVLARNSTASPRPLPPPEPRNNEECTGAPPAFGGRKRHDGGGRRSSYKRRRRENAREPRSVPLSGEPSRHGPPPTQVRLYIQGAESTSRYRVGSAGAVALTPLELPPTGSVRDILFFTTN